MKDDPELHVARVARHVLSAIRFANRDDFLGRNKAIQYEIRGALRELGLDGMNADAAATVVLGTVLRFADILTRDERDEIISAVRQAELHARICTACGHRWDEHSAYEDDSCDCCDCCECKCFVDPGRKAK